MCNHCSYHTSTESELNSAHTDADDYTRAAYWAAQDAQGSSQEDGLALSGDPAANTTASNALEDDDELVDD